MKATDQAEFFANLNAGVFAGQIGRALSDVAAGVVEHSKKGKVTITLEVSRIKETHQVNINHKLEYHQPTKRGSKKEDIALDTPMHVTAKGLSLFPDNPTGELFSKKDAPVTARD